jgi:hypothetical protein
MKVLLGFLLGILAVVFVLVLVAGYFGFVPGIAAVFGSDKPRDLGVTYTQNDYQSARQKSNIKRVDLPPNTPPEQSLVCSGEHAANFNLTDNEVTALINEKSWRYFPVHDGQVRFNADGTAEMSGILELDTLEGYARARGYSEEDFKVVTDWLGRFAMVQKDMPFFVKGTGSVGGSIDFNILKLELGRFSVPVDQINGRKAELINLLEEGLGRIDGFSVNKLNFSNGQMHFEGTLPDQVNRATGNTD